MCRCKPVGITRSKGSTLYFLLVMFMFFYKELLSIKRREVTVVFNDKFVHVVQCFSIKNKKGNSNCFVLSPNVFTSGDTEY